MRLDRRPLLDTSVDADLFVGRDAEVQRLLRAVDLGLNAVVTGPRGIGVTSLLRRLAWCLRQRRSAPELVHLSASGVPDAVGLLHGLYRRLTGDEAAAVATLAGLDAEALIERIGGVVAERPDRTVLLVDDLPVPVGRVLFGSLRDEVWRLQIAWVVGVEADAADALLSAPVDAFFEVVVPLSPLSPEEAAELVRRRVDGADGPALTDDELARLVPLADGHPRRSIDLVRAVLVDGTPPAELAAQLGRREAQLEQVSPPAAALAAELETLGAASPSDRTLQERMGVSRPRLVALFGELKEAGLVREAAPDRNGSRPGRPRIRYVLGSGPSGGSNGIVGGLRDADRDDR